ncbi:MAG: FtsX-like permease family protein [Phycisphaeraceae bacterium]|nr:FtsX-like permease family protein [Phycisphaeraceae bacterium]
MRAPWRLAISSLWQRRSRSILLLFVVALSAALVCAVATAMASVTGSLRSRMLSAVGAADLQLISPGSAKRIDATLLETIALWPETESVSGRLRAAAALRVVRPAWKLAEVDGTQTWPRSIRSSAVNTYIESFRPGFDERYRPVELSDGRMPRSAEEIAIDHTVLDRLRGIEPRTDRRSGTLSALISGTPAQVPQGTEAEGQELGPVSASNSAEAARLTSEYQVKLGDTIDLVRAGKPDLKLRIVGVAPHGMLGGRPRAWMTPEAIADATDQRGVFSEVEIALIPGIDPQSVAATRSGQMPPDVILQPTAKVTTNLERNLRANNVGLVIASTLAFLSAAFIILTGMTTGVVERQRELAILRCIGASRGQIAGSQIIAGLILGTLGSILGVPIGVGLASAVIWWFQQDLKIELAFPALGIGVGVLGSITAGLLGAAFPAWRAARMEPLKALSARADVPRASSIGWTLAVGLLLISIHLAVVSTVRDAETLFFSYVLLALPCMFVGFFLLGVPAVSLVVRVFGAPIAAVLRVPRTLLERSIRRTPYRHGLTAGALMSGLAMMVALWTQGNAFARDWLGRIQFPDAFVTGIALSDASVAKLRELPEVTGASPLSLVRANISAEGMTGLGIGSLQQLKTAFIGFDADSFFRLMSVTWVQGDRDTAIRRLNEGGSIIVAREFLTSKGLGVGKRVKISYQNHSHEFEIVGVVTSPGLDIVSNFFDLGDMYVDQAVSAVFGSRADLRDKLLGGNEPPTQIISLSLAKDTDDAEVTAKIRRELYDYGVLDVGTGRFFKQLIEGAIGRSLYIVSAIAVMSMLVASLGVANLIVAAIESRRFEFGVLRAVGASRGMVCRLVLAEAVIVAIAACIVGVAMGIQGSYGGVRLNAAIMGIELSLRPQFAPILIGCAILIALTLLAATPAVLALSRQQPRELLASMKG